MITVRVERDGSGALTGLVARGHARLAESGQDIVCAAVSALLQAAVVGLEERLKLAVTWRAEKGSMRMQLPDLSGVAPDVRFAATVLLDTVLLSLQAIAQDWPQNVRLMEEGKPDDKAGRQDGGVRRR
ncbi:MAG: ribosomal-processing cysteine protease Prp [Candidatus Xenobia bacterium]